MVAVPTCPAPVGLEAATQRPRGRNGLNQGHGWRVRAGAVPRGSVGGGGGKGEVLAPPPPRRAPPIRRPGSEGDSLPAHSQRRAGQPNPPRLEVQLNRRLRRAQRHDIVLYLVRRHVRDFDFINCATALSRLGHLSASLSARELEELCSSEELPLLIAKMENVMWHCNPQAMANAMWALGRLRYFPGEQFLQVLADRALWCLNDFKPQEMSSLVWGINGLSAGASRRRLDGQYERYNPEGGLLMELLNSLCEQATLSISEFGVRELCQLLWSLGKLEFYHPYFMPVASDFLQQATIVNEQDLSNIAWACAALQFYDEQLLALVDSLAVSIADRISPLASSSILTSFAKLGYNRGRSTALLAEKAAQQPGAFSRQQLCNVLWALGVLQSAKMSVAKALGRELEQRFAASEGHVGLDYSQAFHAGLMMNMQWKTGNVRTVMGLSGKTWARMRDSWLEVVAEQSSQTSVMQVQVCEVLDSLHVRYSLNCATRDGLMCVGIAVGSSQADVALEVESTDHYSVNGTHRALGERLIRRQLLEARGWKVAVVTAHKWNRLHSPWDRALYISGVLSASGVQSMRGHDNGYA